MNSGKGGARRGGYAPAPKATFPASRAAAANARAERRKTPIGTLIACSAAALLVFGQLTALGANSAWLGAISAVLDIALAIALLLAWPPARSFWAKVRPVFALLLLAALWTTLPVIGAIVPPLGANYAAWPAPDLFGVELAKLLGAIACILAGALIGNHPGASKRAIDLFILVGIAWLMLSIGLHSADPTHVWDFEKGLQVDRFTATLLNANAAGCVLASLVTLATARLLMELREGAQAGWPERIWIPIVAFALAACLFFGGIVATRSRLDLVLALTAVLLLVISHSLAGVERRKLRIVIGAAVVVAPVSLLLFALGDPVLVKLLHLGDDSAARIVSTRHFLDLSFQAPWFGRGLGSFRDINLAALTPETAPSLWDFGAAHCAPIQAALEGGWPFALLICAAVAVAAWRILRSMKPSRPDRLARALLIAIAIPFACGMVDIALNVPAVLAFTGILGGMALGRARA